MLRPEGIQYKDYSCEIQKGMDKEGHLTALISTDTEDRMGEVLMPQGVNIKNYNKNPVVLWAHNYEMPPIAKALWTKKTDRGVMSKMEFAKTAFAQEIKMLYEEGFMSTFSVGFVPTKWEDGDGVKNPNRTYTEWELLEYSAVPVPANPDALALAINKGMKISQETIDYLTPKKETEEIKIESIKMIPLEDLLAENKQLQERITSLESELSKAKFELYAQLTKNNKKLSETIGIDLEEKIREIATRVVRKAQGAV